MILNNEMFFELVTKLFPRIPELIKTQQHILMDVLKTCPSYMRGQTDFIPYETQSAMFSDKLRNLCCRPIKCSDKLWEAWYD